MKTKRNPTSPLRATFNQVAPRVLLSSSRRAVLGLIAGYAPIILLMASLMGVNAAVVSLEDFEGATPAWTVEGTANVWEIGVTTFANGPAAHSGSRCAGTVLAGNYPND